jgi:hypothetical protein
MRLAENGLRERYREPFVKYDHCMRDEKAARSEAEKLDNNKIKEIVQRDAPMVRQEVQSIIRRLYDEIYP